MQTELYKNVLTCKKTTMSDSLLRLAEELLRLEDSLLRLVDRLVDNPIFELSASLYFAYIQRVMPKLEDMADFFTYSVII